jgi:ABC-2 type transport system ATP-binding protein
MQAGKVVVTGIPSELKADLDQDNATLDDVFIHYTGDQMKTGGGSYRETSRNRRTAQRLG